MSDGNKHVFSTGAQRDTAADKWRPDLMPVELIREFTEHLRENVHRYGEHNWMLGMDASRTYQSLLRHVFEIGTVSPDDWNENHIMAVMFGAAALWRARQIDRRWPRQEGPLWDLPIEGSPDFMRGYIEKHKPKETR